MRKKVDSEMNTILRSDQIHRSVSLKNLIGTLDGLLISSSTPMIAPLGKNGMDSNQLEQRHTQKNSRIFKLIFSI
jgi:hypothetical protein